MNQKAFHQEIHAILANKTPHITHFLTEEEQAIISQITKGNNVDFAGGFLNPSRQRAYFFTDIKEDITCLRLTLKNPYAKLTHPKILGSLMGLEIARDRVGDIIAEKGLVYVTNDVKDTLRYRLEKIGKSPVHVTEIDGSAIEKTVSLRPFNIIVSSMRLDVIVAAILHTSRSKSQSFIKNNHVKINHFPTDDSKQMLAIDDILSIHREGRFVIMETLKTTRKGKYLLKIGKYT
ncbi:MAG: YlmH/Sll1252 family protein [Candidatus Izemoplasma sp.]|nr:YlmH/Sll1252 family protein [Candidatus Izemoplasma sp.]